MAPERRIFEPSVLGPLFVDQDMCLCICTQLTLRKNSALSKAALFFLMCQGVLARDAFFLLAPVMATSQLLRLTARRLMSRFDAVSINTVLNARDLIMLKYTHGLRLLQLNDMRLPHENHITHFANAMGEFQSVTELALENVRGSDERVSALLSQFPNLTRLHTDNLMGVTRALDDMDIDLCEVYATGTDHQHLSHVDFANLYTSDDVDKLFVYNALVEREEVEDDEHCVELVDLGCLMETCAQARISHMTLRFIEMDNSAFAGLERLRSLRLEFAVLREPEMLDISSSRHLASLALIDCEFATHLHFCKFRAKLQSKVNRRLLKLTIERARVF